MQANEASAFRMSWEWARYAVKYQVSMRNWPNSLIEKALWPKKGFKLSKISDATIRRMARGVERKMGYKWQPWLDDDDEDQGEDDVDEDEDDNDMSVVEIVPWTDGELLTLRASRPFFSNFIHQRRKPVPSSSWAR